MNQTIECMLKHRSIRRFKDESLTKEQINTIVECAQMASTSSYIQAYSIIGVTEQGKKEQLAVLSGNQKYVAQNGHFFVFCADLYRHQKIAEWKNIDMTESLESTEMFMVGVIDAALAAQNAALACESMGLGICYIGGLRNQLHEVTELLQLPKHVVPLFGLAVGYPEQDPILRPRYPMSVAYHENVYQIDEEALKKQLDEFDEVVSAYYVERTKGRRNETWTNQMKDTLKEAKRTYIKDYLTKQGFPLK
ncbi:oxygen-insensitive NADPH nitroreductase [Massilibacterium senegalense]|uniref:oxygen-insensitive NADPH nitroreductase n=1 Tax=Massilibacterium senegalense TaxID=1632858 RepID=UPI000780678D|nr:oxygen-insensitive NADPH nitroreductase [Massilibacterium senegalense]